MSLPTPIELIAMSSYEKAEIFQVPENRIKFLKLLGPMWYIVQEKNFKYNLYHEKILIRIFEVDLVTRESKAFLSIERCQGSKEL